jgi:multisubunit Na+/H+ antiporter MnhC subunit
MLNLVYALAIAVLVVIGIELLMTLGKLVSVVMFIALAIAGLLYLVRHSRTDSETPPPSKGHRLGE